MTRGPLDLEVRIENLQDSLIEHEKTLEKQIEENSNLKTIISKLQDEKLDMQKELADLQYQLNIKNYGKEKNDKTRL